MALMAPWAPGRIRREFAMRDEIALTGAYDAFSSSIEHAYVPARRVLSSYSHLEPLMCVRRDSDDAEDCFLPVSETNPELNKVNVASFLGGGSGYYYWVADQAGGDHITQATAAEQPLYVADAQNGHAGITVDSDVLSSAFSEALSQPVFIMAIARLDASAVNDGNYRFFIDGDDGTNRMAAGQDASPAPNTWQIRANNVKRGGNSDSNWNLWSILLDDASSQFWINNSSEWTGTTSANPDGITVGRGYNGFWWKGRIASIVIADPAPGGANQQALEDAANSYWSVY